MKDERKKTLTPKLRFPEFKDWPEWEEKSLDALLSPIVREREKPAGPYTGLGLRSHGKGTFLKPFEAPEKNTMEHLFEVQEDDLIVNITFAWEGAIAIAGSMDAGALVSHRFPTYTFKEGEALPDFFRYSIFDKQLFYQLGVISPGGAGRNRVLNKRDFLKLKRFVPRLAEQRKIAACLTLLDELLGAEGQKLEALAAHKKGLMQQLFPRPCESCPRLRFPEFRAEAEWQEKALRTLAVQLLDGDWIESKDQSSDGIRLLQTGNVGEGNFIPKSDNARFISEQTFERLGCTEVNPGDCLISRLPDPIGRACIVPEIGSRMITAVDCTIARFDENQMLPYLFVAYSQTEQYLKQIAGLASGSTRSRISRDNLSNVKVPLPEPAEQQRIAACLSSLDALIAAQSRKVDGLRAHKKGLMQQLLPSPEGT